MIIIISRGKKAKGIFLGGGNQLAQDATTALFGVARGVLESNPAVFADVLENVNNRLRKIMKEEDPEE